jgi:hypothetical protein
MNNPWEEIWFDGEEFHDFEDNVTRCGSCGWELEDNLCGTTLYNE